MTAIYAVYTPGKAATTTTHRTLSKLLSERIYDIRRASKDGVTEYLRFAREKFPDMPLRTDEAEFQEAINSHPDAHLHLVSLTREPIAALISSWFFNFSLRHPEADPSTWTTDQHLNGILGGGYASRPDYFTGWFDFECRPFTGIDIYSTPFSMKTGFVTYQSARTDLLLIRSEDLNRVYQQSFLTFFKVKAGQLEMHHVGERSSYGDAYRRFKAEARLPTEFIDSHHHTRYARHFYSKEELARARYQWSDR